jgi:hypothetical protein
LFNALWGVETLPVSLTRPGTRPFYLPGRFGGWARKFLVLRPGVALVFPSREDAAKGGGGGGGGAASVLFLAEDAAIEVLSVGQAAVSSSSSSSSSSPSTTAAAAAASSSLLFEKGFEDLPPADCTAFALYGFASSASAVRRAGLLKRTLACPALAFPALRAAVTDSSA